MSMEILSTGRVAYLGRAAMVTETRFRIPDRHADGHSRAALQFFATAAAVISLAAVITGALVALFGLPTGPARLFPPALWFSTALLFSGSYTLSRAVRFVRIERQREFRRWLLNSLLLGSTFVGVQTYAMLWMMPHDRSAYAASTGVTAFVLALAAMHAMHFIVATLFLSLVTVRAAADRYDHEYYWGVRVCACFWHALGVIWLAILAVFAIAA